MNKWENRANKLDKKKKKKLPPNFKDVSQNDKFKRREIKQARRDKEAIWDNMETEGDEWI